MAIAILCQLLRVFLGWLSSGISGFAVCWLGYGLSSSPAFVAFLLPRRGSVGKVRVKCGKAKQVFSLCGQRACSQAQQVSQRDAPPVGGFEVWFFIEVRRLR